MALNQFPRRSFVGSSTLQTFTGDGTTTAFTLSSAQTQNEVFLFVDDVAQVPGVDFTVSGTTLTFATAPANSSEIIARGFGVPAPVTTVSDGSVTAAKLATGAIEAKLGYTPVSPTQLSNEVAALVDSSPSTLNTLNELAAALGDDANYASTITTALGTKADSSSLGTLATVSPTGTPDNTKFLRGDNSWQVVAVTPTAVSDQSNTSTGYFDLPSGTTAQRPASPAAGMSRFNTTDGKFEFYDGTSWIQLKPAFIATGGTITNSGAYIYHTFTTSGSFVVTAGSQSVEVLVVAGGGAGGGSGPTSAKYGGGGGGAGGLVYSSSYSATIGTYTVTVGAGGAGTGPTQNGNNGSNSSFTGLTTAIGGGGGGWDTGPSGTAGSSGGSGGGGAPAGGGGGSGTAGQGNNGGAALSSFSAGGGGGGSGSSGGNGANNVGGNGGNASTYYGASYAGGGGGGIYQSGTPGTGGGNAGSGGALGNNGGNASANYGGGGGGGSGNGGTTSGGNGGSGVVIVRYLS